MKEIENVENIEIKEFQDKKIENIVEIVEEIEEVEEKKEEEKFYTVVGVIFEITKKRYYFEVVNKDEVYKKEIKL